MKVQRRNITAILLASALFAPALVSSASAQSFAPSGITASPDQYADGTRAINDGRWSDAVSIFTKVADARGERADAALYWKAYAEAKQGQASSALETCSRLGRTYRKSRYISDCDALRIEIQGPTARTIYAPGPIEVPNVHVEVPPVHVEVPQVHVDVGGHHEPPNPDEEMKLLALNSLMQQDEARALPAVQQILNGNGSERLKERALFVLAQSKSPQAQQIISQVVHNQANPALQVRAIRMYAAIAGPRSVDTLSDVYQHSSDVNVKRAVLQSYLITHSPDKVLAAARGEQNPELSSTAIHTLGAMHGINELAALYRDSKDTRVKRDVLGAFVAAGPDGAEQLKSIASSEQDPELRRRAIRNLGVTGPSAAPALVSAYQSSSDAESKKAALEGLFISNDSHDLVALARAEKDPALKQAIVSKLSVMRSKEATDYMMEILNK
jgi:hypothetical protein